MPAATRRKEALLTSPVWATPRKHHKSKSWATTSSGSPVSSFKLLPLSKLKDCTCMKRSMTLLTSHRLANGYNNKDGSPMPNLHITKILLQPLLPNSKRVCKPSMPSQTPISIFTLTYSDSIWRRVECIREDWIQKKCFSQVMSTSLDQWSTSALNTLGLALCDRDCRQWVFWANSLDGATSKPHTTSTARTWLIKLCKKWQTQKAASLLSIEARACSASCKAANNWSRNYTWRFWKPFSFGASASQELSKWKIAIPR